MNSLLYASAFGLAPVGELFARELHAAGPLRLRPDQVTELAETCTRYTEESDRILMQMAALAASASHILDDADLPTEAEAAEVEALLVERSRLLLEWERTYVARRLAGLRGLDRDQVAEAATLTSDRMAALIHAQQGAPMDALVAAGH
ncbi:MULTISPECIES: hypothetical protein [Frankia]|uniref:Uncharacterized protein n=1 Tax=Frankia alni (strain DSM 45986 / CECT 9034 / ACN14a) TaxID=326424 RepID=Q0RLL5_FRAAA|nr:MULTISPECIES: hypothetical protein [Frankia]CAJ61589.1 hypothetical protein FRAAL2945 [Frankia alni ACN14a]